MWREPGPRLFNGRMDRRRLRRECETLVDDLVTDLAPGEPFGVDDLCERVGERRGQRIRQVPMQLPVGTPHGLWVSTRGVDYVIYEARTAPLHRQHIVLHELGHMLWEHEVTPKIGAASFGALLPDLDPAMVQRILARTRYSDLEERQAELTASLLGERLSAAPPVVARPAPGVVARLEQSLVPRS